MSPTDPQFIYIVLALPALFSSVLMGEGISKIISGKTEGLISLIIGLLFFTLTIFGYFFFSSYLTQRI